MIIDLCLSNQELYLGCKIIPVPNGSSKARLNLTTPIQDAVDIVKKNLRSILEKELIHDEIILTGGTKLEIYLAVCAIVAPLATTIIHQNGKKKTIIK
jgi:hypothetical protein